MTVRKDAMDGNEIEIALSEEAIDRIEEYWLQQIDVSRDDYVYVKKVDNHLVIGKAEITFIE